MEEVGQAVLQTVEDDVAERLAEVWRKGAKAVQQVQREGERSNEEIAKKVAEIRESQGALEAENEKLKEVIAQLAQQLSSIGAAVGIPWSPAASPTASPCLSASTAPGLPVDNIAPFAPLLSPQASCEAAQWWRAEEPWNMSVRSPAASGTSTLMPEIPPFPFPAPTTPVATPVSATQAWPPMALVPGALPVPPSATLSLADALGIETQEDPLPSEPSELKRSSSGPSTPTTVASPLSELSEDVDAYVFNLTLRVADGLDLGLTTSQSGRGSTLRIERVLPGGAAEAWNRQCSSSGAASRVLAVGDRITSVNDIAGSPQAMVQECSSKRLLRFQIVRGSTRFQQAAASPLPSPSSSSTGSSRLRVDASVFVPKAGAGAAGATSAEEP